MVLGLSCSAYSASVTLLDYSRACVSYPRTPIFAIDCIAKQQNASLHCDICVRLGYMTWDPPSLVADRLQFVHVSSLKAVMVFRIYRRRQAGGVLDMRHIYLAGLTDPCRLMPVS
jgi:hypothetical protein